MQLGQQSIEILLPCEPFCVSGQCYIDKGALVIPFKYIGKREKCSCGEEYRIHARRTIRLAAPSVGLHKKVFWEVEYCLYRCDNCDYYTTQYIPFRFGKTRCTTFLAKDVCDDLDSNSRSISDSSKCFGLGWDTVKNIHKSYLEEVKMKCTIPNPPKICVVDEFSVEKGHKYATLVIDSSDKEVLYLHKGKSTEDFRPFFKEHNSSWYKGIEAFAMDQNAQYAKVVKEELPEALIVADYFHMLKNYTSDVLDKVRLRTARSYLKSGDRASYEKWKASKRLLSKRIKSEDEIDDESEWEAQFMLSSMMDSCAELDVCVHMKELLHEMYDKCRNYDSMEKKWDEWIKMAKASEIKELSHFAEKKDKKREEILSHAKMPISSGVIEGCMNKIKVIKRTAFGFRDFDYFFDRIWYAFLPWQKKMEARNKVWECYELNFPELSGETIEQQKTG